MASAFWTLIKHLLEKVQSWWRSIPEETKTKVYLAVAEFFASVFKAKYDEHQSNAKKANGAA